MTLPLDSPAIPVALPLLPSAEALIPFLKRIDRTRYYSNWGGLCVALEAALAGLWGVEKDEVAALCSGTSALIAALAVTKRSGRPLCVMPSWTFVATAHAAARAGLEPYFLDVDPATWALTPAIVSALPEALLHRVGVVLPVSPFGAPINSGVWDAFSARTGVPVVIDAAAAFDTLTPARVPSVVSLHATKAFGVGEGGAVISTDPDVIARIKSYANFGFVGGREALGVGENAKLSEYGAAVGLASFEAWPQSSQALRQRQAAYNDALRDIHPHWFAAAVAPEWASTTYPVALPTEAVTVGAALAELGIGTRQWWGTGCHRQAAFAHCGHEDLPHTDWLARHVIGLPLFVDMDMIQIRRVVTSLAALTNGSPEAPRCSPWPAGAPDGESA